MVDTHFRLHKLLTGSFLWDSGHTARMHRRFGLSTLRSLGVGKKSLEHKINEEIRYLIERIDAEKSRPFDPCLSVQNAVSNIICTICFGYRFDYADERFQKMLNILNSSLSSSGPDAIGNVFQPLIDTPLYSQRRALCKTMTGFINGIVKVK